MDRIMLAGTISMVLNAFLWVGIIIVSGITTLITGNPIPIDVKETFIATTLFSYAIGIICACDPRM